MSVRLRNDHNIQQTLSLNSRVWRSALDMAGRNGWMPMGTIRPEMLTGLSFIGIEENSDDHNRLASGIAQGSYSPQLDRMVLLEDALNLADALERAFLEREPGCANPERIFLVSDWEERPEEARPGIGVMQALVSFFRHGAFWIERR